MSIAAFVLIEKRTKEVLVRVFTEMCIRCTPLQTNLVFIHSEIDEFTTAALKDVFPTAITYTSWFHYKKVKKVFHLAKIIMKNFKS